MLLLWLSAAGELVGFLVLLVLPVVSAKFAAVAVTVFAVGLMHAAAFWGPAFERFEAKELPVTVGMSGVVAAAAAAAEEAGTGSGSAVQGWLLAVPAVALAVAEAAPAVWPEVPAAPGAGSEVLFAVT